VAIQASLNRCDLRPDKKMFSCLARALFILEKIYRSSHDIFREDGHAQIFLKVLDLDTVGAVQNPSIS
jgi:hypothetical protein